MGHVKRINGLMKYLRDNHNMSVNGSTDKLKLKSTTNGDAPSSQSTLACGGNCAECVGEVCTQNHIRLEQKRDEEAAKKSDATLAAKKAFPETVGDKTGNSSAKTEGGNK